MLSHRIWSVDISVPSYACWVSWSGTGPRGGPDAPAEPAEDVYAALRAISRLAPASSVVLKLHGADLRNANLGFMRGTQVHLGGADLAGAKLSGDWKALIQPRGQ